MAKNNNNNNSKNNKEKKILKFELIKNDFMGDNPIGFGKMEIVLTNAQAARANSKIKFKRFYNFKYDGVIYEEMTYKNFELDAVFGVKKEDAGFCFGFSETNHPELFKFLQHRDELIFGLFENEVELYTTKSLNNEKINKIYKDVKLTRGVLNVKSGNILNVDNENGVANFALVKHKFTFGDNILYNTQYFIQQTNPETQKKIKVPMGSKNELVDVKTFDKKTYEKFEKQYNCLHSVASFDELKEKYKDQESFQQILSRQDLEENIKKSKCSFIILAIKLNNPIMFSAKLNADIIPTYCLIEEKKYSQDPDRFDSDEEQEEEEGDEYD